MAQQRDWLKDCMKDCADKGLQASLQEFKATFCDACVQPECNRSLFGKSKFEQRVSNWHERLFTAVPRMDLNDPRFPEISSKGFVIINPEALSVNASSDWLDPRDIKPVSVSVPETVSSPSEVVEEVPVIDAPPPTSPRPATPTLSAKDAVLVNTPSQRGIMLPGAPQITRPQRDQWDSPQPVRPGEKVVQRGATFRFGGVEGETPKKTTDEGGPK
jgi:hypothetical protein